MFSSVDPSLAAGKMHQNVLSHMAFGMILQDHRRLPLCIFRGQNRRFRVFEEGYCKDFKKLVSNFIETGKNFDFNFFNMQ
jgi:hypothetical protein